MGKALFACLLCAALASPAFAHKVNVFASVQGGVIEGECYASDGGMLRRAAITFYGPDGSKLGETTTDAEGQFRYTPAASVDHEIVLETDDGHRAEFLIPAQDLGGTSSAEPAAAVTTQNDTPVATPDDLDSRISEAVAREVRPLQRQLDRFQNQTRLRDILGGIGYIVGIAGIVFFFKGTQRKA